MFFCFHNNFKKLLIFCSKKLRCMRTLKKNALVVELVDTQDLKSCSNYGVRVRFPPWAPIKNCLINIYLGSFFVLFTFKKLI